MKLATTSSLSAARACQRLHKLSVIDGMRPVVVAETLRFGTLIDKAIEAYWNADGAPTQLDDALAALAGEADPFDKVKAEALVRGYVARWSEEPYSMVAVQPKFRVPLVNPATGAASRTWELGGKIDAIVRDRRDGRVLIVETKTSSEQIGPGSDYWRRLRMNGQVSIYYEGARGLGYDVAGVLYDVIGKPGIRPLKATPVEDRKYTKPTKKDPESRLYANMREADETPDEYLARLVEDIAADPAGYYQRGEVVRLEAEMADAMHDVWQTTQQIHEATRAGRFPRNPDACVRYGRTCEFFGVCTGEASIDDPHLFRKTVAHPELAEPATEPKEEATDGNAPSSTP